ncbi:EboA domain-containing protein [Salegentibacter sp. JZCK2]|uniref:EboA domain-containing protein n=1 Tax=Salegentibacter tibetensis TaxID=2873600 RepID=UPI001CCC05F4|nr:EboA domain-containing protein [Salegentibacter tibetensis]MBZ9731435.1 EboA domain-containing protein [Salegentibacter tibetensis]
MKYQVNSSEATAFLRKIIEERVDEKGLEWINLQETTLRDNFQLRSFYLTFSTAPRFIKKNSLSFTKEERIRAEKLRRGFQPQHWDLLQCVRTYFLVMLPGDEEENFIKNITRLFETADLDEQVAMYGALPLLTFPTALITRTREGLRTNITDVFDAIVLDNPYPADFLGQDAWNQMLLKAVFMQRPLYRIYNADERVNPELAKMLVDFAHERWAASRDVLPELWRFIAPYLEDGYFSDIKKVVKGKPLEKQAGLLACNMSAKPEAQQLLNKYPEVKEDIGSGRLNWETIGKENETKQKV